MRLTAISWERLAEALAERIAGLGAEDGGRWTRVAVDGAPAARPQDLAQAVAELLPPRGRAVFPVDAGRFLRSASLRYEYGRHDPDGYYERWLDTGALRREVFDPLGPGGSGRALPSLWDPETDRATRARYVAVPPGAVLLLHGALLLGHWFPLDLSVHLRLSEAALERRTAGGDRWVLPAFARYEDEVRPSEVADVVVRCDDPRRPAWTG